MRIVSHRHLQLGIGLLLVLVISALPVHSQQNTTLFTMHGIVQSNFINPAVQHECKYFVGLPVISSLHIHAGNSGFTASQLLHKAEDGSFSLDNQTPLQKMARVNLFGTELHATLLAFGIKRNDYDFFFSITEKNDLAVIYNRDLFDVAVSGNTKFEGQWIRFGSSAMFFNHLREYALGVSKHVNRKLTVGVRAKLLFGKMNVETRNTRARLYTHENTFHLDIDLDAGFNSSMLHTLGIDGGGNYRVYRRYDMPIGNLLMNNKNPGFAIDLGFIYRRDKRTTISASVLNLGMIFFRSNLTNYDVEGSLTYTGPLGTPINDDLYLWGIFDDLNRNMDASLTYEPYRHILDPRLYLGFSRVVNPKLDASLVLYNRFFSDKWQNGATVSLLAKPWPAVHAAVSWSYLYRSFANLGVGIMLGRKHLQAYLVSDNLLGIVMPMDVRSANLRFGINLILGCRQETNLEDCGCSWIKEAETRRLNKESRMPRKK